MRSLLLALAASSSLAAAAAAEVGMRMLVPAYQYPTDGTLWSELCVAADHVPLTAILNPDSGPGAEVNTDYLAVVSALRAAGGRLIGYVATDYAARDSARVLGEVRRYAEFYEVDGIFLDEVTQDDSPGNVAHYAALAASIRAFRPDWSLTANPGTNCAPEYVTIVGFDQVVTFEDSSGHDSWLPDPWMWSHPPERFAHLPYKIFTATGMHAALARAAQLNVGSLYVTDDFGNPWDTLPAYWEEEYLAFADAKVVGVEARVEPRADLAPVTNPAFHRVELRCTPEPADRRLVIHDVSGRRLRSIPVVAGATRVTWDGCDGSGSPMPAGLYFARFAEPRARGARFVLAR